MLSVSRYPGHIIGIDIDISRKYLMIYRKFSIPNGTLLALMNRWNSCEVVDPFFACFIVKRYTWPNPKLANPALK